MPDTAASSGVVDHAFTATPWWGLCTRCGFSKAAHRIVLAHSHAQMQDEHRALPRRCDACVKQDRHVVDLTTGVVTIDHFKCTHGGTDA